MSQTPELPELPEILTVESLVPVILFFYRHRKVVQTSPIFARWCCEHAADILASGGVVDAARAEAKRILDADQQKEAL